MKKTIPELTIRYDEKRGRLILSASRDGRGGRLKDKTPPFSVEWPIDQLKTQSDLGETAIGAAVLAFLDRVSGGLGLKDYRGQARRDEAEIIVDLRQLAKNKDSSAQYSLAMLLLRRAAKQKSLKDVEEAERWLKAAAEGGNSDASAYLKTDWSSAKRAVTERIQSRSSR